MFVAAATIVTAAGLPNLEFHGGRLLEIIHIEVGPNEPFDEFLGAIIVSFIKGILILSIALLPVLIIYQLSRAQGRMLLVIFLCLGILLVFFMKHLPKGLNLLPSPRSEVRIEAPTDAKPLAPGEEMSPIPPNWLVVLFSLGLSSVAVGLLIILLRNLPRRVKPLDLVAREAQKTLEELRSGSDIRESVVRCYFEMLRVVSEQRGLERGRTTTTRELEKELAAMGLPAAHVRRLTRLFEKVRYGAKRLREEEEQEAVACLSAIVQACEGSR